MTFAPIAPATYVPPAQIAKDTFVVHQVQPDQSVLDVAMSQPPT
jgi:hypothetical protein